MKGNIVILGTLDTKGEEFLFLKENITQRGFNTTVVDLGILGEPAFPADISREEVILRSGESIDALQSGDFRGRAINAVITGGKSIVRALYESGHLDGVVAMGGGTGTTIGMQIMNELPIGVVKVQVTTLTDLTHFIGNADICVIRSMVDLVGLNSVTRTIIQEAAGAVTGMASSKPVINRTGKCVAITCLGVTTPAVMKIRERLLSRNKEVLVLHRRTDAVSMLMKEDLLECMIDITPSEMQKGFLYPEGAPNMNRLMDVRNADIPLIMAPGALDMLLCPMPPENLDASLKDREMVIHSPNMTLLATTMNEYIRQAHYCADILNSAKGPTMMLIPIKGFSVWSAPGKPFSNPKAIKAFADTFNDSVSPRVGTVLVEANLNDDTFADAIMLAYDRLVERRM